MPRAKPRKQARVKAVRPATSEVPLASLLKSAASAALASGVAPAEVGRIFAEISTWVQEQPPVVVPTGSASLIQSAADLVQCWSSDVEFLGERAVPLALPLEGEAASFSALVRREGSFATPAEALEVLIRHNVAASDGTTVTLLDRAVIADPRTPEGLARAWMSSLAHLNTLLRNVSGRPPEDRWPERTAINLRFPVSAVPALATLVRAEGQKFLVYIDQMMRENEAQAAQLGEPTQAVGVGFWQFDVPTIEAPKPPKRAQPKRRKTVRKPR